MIRHKLIRGETKVIDAKAGRVEAVVSTESTDRQGDIIRQEHWDLKNFLLHPVLLASHNYYDLRSQIGEWEEMAVKGHKLVGLARYYVGEGNEQADWGFNLASKGRAAFSVGFIPDMEKAKVIEDEDDEDSWARHYEFMGQELLEASHVTIPANPEALQGVRGVKGLHPAIAEIIDETLRDMCPAITLSASFDSQTQALIDAVAERIAATLRKSGLATPPSPAGAVVAPPPNADGFRRPLDSHVAVGEAVDLAILKEFLLT